MIHKTIPFFCSVGVMFAALSAAAQPASDPCFTANQLQSWRAPDSRTIFIRVSVNRYYRLDLEGRCMSLKAFDAHLITSTHGPQSICSAVDWDLQVSDSSPGSFPESCIVREMRLLTPEEVAAIPPAFKP